MVSKLVSFGSDGAAVVMGCKSGVAAMLKAKIPGLHVSHSMAHRLGLAIKATATILLYFQKVESLLLWVYLFYHQSPLNWHMLHRTCEAHGQTYLVPTRVGRTRWVGHTEVALDHLLKVYQCVKVNLQQIAGWQDHPEASTG